MVANMTMTAAPTDRDEWLAERRKRLGATDVSAILGLNQYKTAYEVWLDKRGMLVDGEPNAAMLLGSRLEPSLLDEAEERWGAMERQMVVHDAQSPIAATLDGWLIDAKRPVEVKTSGLSTDFAEKGHWGDKNTDEVPEWYLVQVQTQLMCTEAERCNMLALIGGRGLVEYFIDRDDEIATMIRQKTTDWWERHIVKGIEPPKDVVPSIDVLKRVRREPNTVVTFGSEVMEMVDQWEAAKAVAKVANDRADNLKARLITELGHADESGQFVQHEAGLLPNGKMLTYLESSRKGYEVKPTTFRTLRIKKG